MAGPVRGHRDKTDPMSGVTDLSQVRVEVDRDERRAERLKDAARATVRRHALDDADHALLLEALGLDGEDD